MSGLISKEIIETIVDLFIDLRKKCDNHILEDTNNRRVHLSLRNLSRTIDYIINNNNIYGVNRSVYDGLYLGFASSFSSASRLNFEKILSNLLNISYSDYNNLLNKTIKFNQDKFLNIFGVLNFLFLIHFYHIFILFLFSF